MLRITQYNTILPYLSHYPRHNIITNIVWLYCL
nr:MAG TPA: hypothetical protein [Herelleviridae sp.]